MIAAPQLGVSVPKEISDILATIRLLESGNTYDLPPNSGRASGAYQYIASTWSNYAGYPHAYLAPPAVQDQRALSDVQAILRRWNQDVSMVPVIWYYPRAAREPAWMDRVPLPQFGNKLTVREYQFRWLDTLQFISGSSLAFRLALLPPDLRFLSGLPPELTYREGPIVDIAFPVLGRALVAPPTPCQATQCDLGSDAVVYGQKLQPILSASDGVVTAIELGDPVSGAISITITDGGGRTYTYSGLNDDTPGTSDGLAPPWFRFTALAEIGRSVKAGQIIGFMGDTDPMPSVENRGTDPNEPVWPHLRLTIRGRDGLRIDADALVAAAQLEQACHVGIGPWAVPENPGIPLAQVDDVEVSAILDGGWTIHADGTVTAHGKSAMVVPPADCAWSPRDAFGPGTAGSEAPQGWDLPFGIPARYWVAGALGDGFKPAGLLRRG